MSCPARLFTSFGKALALCAFPGAARSDAPRYVPPSEAVPHGLAPGARGRLLSDVQGKKDYALILSRGDEVFTALTEFAQAHQLRAAHFTAIGALREVQLGWFDEGRKEYKVIPVPGQVEASSVIGDVGLVDGKPVVHVHAVVGLPDGQARAGHLLHAIASPTLEVFVAEEPSSLTKTHDPTGLSLFDLSK